MKSTFLKSVKFRIIIAVVIMVTIPFCILQLTNYFLIYNKLESKTEYTTKALSYSIATNVEEFMQGVYDSSQLLAQNDKIINGEKAGQAILKDAVKRMPYYRLIYVQGTDGKQTLRTSGTLTNRSDRWWFKQIMYDHEPFISEAYVSVNNNELVTSIFLPMYSNSKITGIYGADFTLSTIQASAGQYWNNNISYILMDSKGTVIAGTDYKQGEFINYIDYTKRTVELDANKNYILDANGQIVTKVENIQVSDTMKRIISGALNNKTESFKFKDNSENIVFCAYQPIKLPGKSDPWSVIVFQKQTDNISLILLTIMFLFLLLCSILASLYIIGHSVLKPVIKIQKDMEKIVEGELDVHININGGNEIMELAENINTTVDSLKLQQKKIDENEKMAALGNLVAGVAHEINTPLGIGVTTSTYMSKINNDYKQALNDGRFTKDDLIEYMEAMDESLELLQSNLTRGAKIIHSFKQIAVDQTFDSKETFNVYQYIDSVIISLTHEYKKHNHSFNLNCKEDLTLTSYPGVFAQILTNFIMNSIIHGFKDMEKGKIDITAYRENDTFILIYSDNGCGISKENLQRIFTPFFTTRRGSGGSGLGLHIVHNLVTNKLSGTITVESKLGEYTTFIIKIPA